MPPKQSVLEEFSIAELAAEVQRRMAAEQKLLDTEQQRIAQQFIELDGARARQASELEAAKARQASDLEEAAAQQLLEVEAAKAELAKKEQELQGLADKIHGMVGSSEDVIDINVGGQVHSVSRGTLCLVEGSLLASLFSGRWEEQVKRDSAGRAFLDVDPQCFDQILNFLRLKRIAGPGEAVPPPRVEGPKQDAFRMVLRYYGLTEFLVAELPAMTLTSLSIDPLVAFGTEACAIPWVGYNISFTRPFHLSAVYVGLEGTAAGCSVRVATGDLNIISELPALPKTCPQDVNVTHAAEGFDVVLQPPGSVIRVSTSMNMRYQAHAGYREERAAGEFRVLAKHKWGQEQSEYAAAPCMALLGFFSDL